MGWHQVLLRSLVGSCRREFVYELVYIRAPRCVLRKHLRLSLLLHPARAVGAVLAFLPFLAYVGAARDRAYPRPYLAPAAALKICRRSVLHVIAKNQVVHVGQDILSGRQGGEFSWSWYVLDLPKNREVRLDAKAEGYSKDNDVPRRNAIQAA
jgi:hypothetical protein